MQLPSLETINTPSAALWVGVITSLHCVGMCGPLLCAFTHSKKKSNQGMLLTYHGSRVLSYGLVGSLAGLLGQSILGLFSNDIARILPWVLVMVFVLVALGLDKRLPIPIMIQQIGHKLNAWAFKQGMWKMGFMMGLGSPFLPCGPLYLIFGICLVSGSWLQGGLFGVFFALGTIPLLWIVQSQFFYFQSKISPQWLRRIQCSMALVSALIMAWRLVEGDIFQGVEQPGGCPVCHSE
ncbi:MAG: sulfite exporter TauE/SafE family protein [Verrucomicrobiota bacterium]